MDHRWVRQNEDPHHPYLQCSACGLSGYEPMPKGGCDGRRPGFSLRSGTLEDAGHHALAWLEQRHCHMVDARSAVLRLIEWATACEASLAAYGKEFDRLAAERERLRPLLQAALDRLTGAGPQCPAFIRYGPGHQSTTRCQVKGPHEIHEARYGKFDLEARWRGEAAGTGFFDDMPDEDLGDDEVRRTAEQELIESLKAEIARTGGGA